MEPILIYTDGACSNNGYAGACAGIGIFFGMNDARNVSEKIEGKQTNNVAELLAIFEAGKIMKTELENKNIIHLYTDSQYAIRCVTTYGEKLEKKGWKNGSKVIPNLELVKKTYLLYKPYDTISFKYIKAHTSLKDKHSIGNDYADKLAQNAIKKKKIQKTNLTEDETSEEKKNNDNDTILRKLKVMEIKLDEILNKINNL